MIRLEKILVALDLSEHSRVAMRYAAELARAFSAEVIACHVVEHVGMIAALPAGSEAYFPPNLVEVQSKRAREEAERLIRELSIARARVEIREGKAFVEIVRLARDEDVDLIVVGTHGWGAIAHVLLGSVAEKVVRKAPCPVLTVRAGEREYVTE